MFLVAAKVAVLAVMRFVLYFKDWLCLSGVGYLTYLHSSMLIRLLRVYFLNLLRACMSSRKHPATVPGEPMLKLQPFSLLNKLTQDWHVISCQL